MHRLCLLLLLLIASCQAPAGHKTIAPVKDTISIPQADTAVRTSAATDTAVTDESMALYYIVIADTAADYDRLHRLMGQVAKQLVLPIDTMGRGYDRAKNLIALPEDDEDEIYAGDYYPRRFPGLSLSIEYMNVYHGASGEKTMALVAGICTTTTEADSLLRLLRPAAPSSFIKPATIYIGCMH